MVQRLSPLQFEAGLTKEDFPEKTSWLAGNFEMAGGFKSHRKWLRNHNASIFLYYCLLNKQSVTWEIAEERFDKIIYIVVSQPLS